MAKNIFLFPGQGAQHVGMGKALHENFSSVKALFEEAEDAIKYKLSRLCFDGPESDLKLTQNTQPAILTVSIAAFRVLTSETGLRPSLVAGHSLGEYSALVSAEAMSFSDAVTLVHKRGKAMQSAVPVGKGAMAAFMGATPEQVLTLCKEATDSFSSEEEFVAPANFNGGGQIVVSGTSSAVDKGIELASKFGIRRAKRLDVSAPFHCRLMQPAADSMAKLLETVTISKPKVPYISNVDAGIHSDEVGIRDRLVRQIPNAVLWEDSMKCLTSENITAAFEIGPGKVLTGLLRRINKEVKGVNIQTPEDLKQI